MTIIEEHIFHMTGATSPQLRQPEHATESVLQHDQAEMIKVLADGGPSAIEVEPPSGKSKVLEDNLATA